MANLLRDEPFVISHLVRTALLQQGATTLETVLARHTADEQNEAILRSLRQRFTHVGQEELMIVAIRSERATGDRLFRNIEERKLGIYDVVDDKSGRRSTLDSIEARVINFAYRPKLGHDHAVFLRYMNEAITTLHRPTWERYEEVNRLDESIRMERSPKTLLSGLLLSALLITIQAELRSLAVMRSTELAIACELYRIKHGRWPENIDELKTELPDGVPLDPWTGNPMTFVHRVDGVDIPRSEAEPPPRHARVVQAWDQDDADAEPEQPPYFRLWDPEARSLPPLPEPEPEPDFDEDFFLWDE